jgi:hypothetical protein
MGNLTLSEWQTALATHRINPRRLRITGDLSIGYAAEEAFIEVFNYLQRNKSGLELVLHGHDTFIAFLEGDYVGTLRITPCGEFVISGWGISRQRAAVGIDKDEEFSTSPRVIANKMAQHWGPISVPQLRMFHQNTVREAYLSGKSPTFKSNLPDISKVNQHLARWNARVLGMVGDAAPTAFVLYHMLLETKVKQQTSDEWDAAPLDTSMLPMLVDAMPEPEEFIADMKDYLNKLRRRHLLYKAGYILRINKEGYVNLATVANGSSTDTRAKAYPSLDTLLACIPEHSERVRDGINALRVAGLHQYVDGVGMAMHVRDEVGIRVADTDTKERLGAWTMFWLEPDFLPDPNLTNTLHFD